MKSITKSQLTAKQINSISMKVWDEKIKETSELTDGWFNTAYAIETLGGHKGVIKIAPPSDIEVMNYELNIIDTEVSVMKMIEAETSVPIPQIYTYDKSYEIASSEYFVMEKIEGLTYNHVKESLSEKQRGSIETCLGEYNRQINSIKHSKYGLYSTSSKKFSNWYQCYKNLVLMLLNDGERKNVDIGMPYSQIISLVESLKNVLMVVKEPSLVHTDLWDGNFLVCEDTLTGLIDFERCLWGDPLMEVYFWISKYSNFTKGYGEEIVNEKHFDIRRNLYAFHMALAMVMECPYRMYDDDGHIQWAMDHFKEKYNALLKCIDTHL